MTMKGQVCVVTGASRGIGRGIALQLCQAGATVYITGRHLDTLRATAQEAQSLGGRCVPVVCDSSQESEVKSLFEQVDREQQGRLDVLVNNAYAGVQAILNTTNKSFWEAPASLWDDMNNVGLRGHYLCSVYGARLMVPAGKGLIVVVSSPGGLQHMFNVPYGVGKAAVRTKAQELGRYTTVSTVVRAVRPSSLSLSHALIVPLCGPPSIRPSRYQMWKDGGRNVRALEKDGDWGILLDSGRAEEEGETGRCSGSHFCRLSLHSATNWLLTVPMSYGVMESATYLCGQAWCKQKW